MEYTPRNAWDDKCDRLCGNCGQTFGRHAGTIVESASCPNVDGSHANGTRGTFKVADGTEVFYNVWFESCSRWTDTSYENVSHKHGNRFATQTHAEPFRLSLKEAERWRDYIGGEEFQVRAIGPKNTSILLCNVAAYRATLVKKIKESEKSRELSFFRSSKADNTCSKCSAPRPCLFHG